MVLRFHDEPQVSTAVVRLGDIVEIVSGSLPSLDKLRETPLGPAPQKGALQTWHRSDVLQHLELRGMDPQSIRWTGPEKAQLRVTDSIEATQQSVDTLSPAFIAQRVMDIATSNVSLGIKEYLNLRSSSRTDWKVDLAISGDQAKLLQSRNNIVSIGGGQEPWTGQQTFVIQVKNLGKLINYQVAATVHLPPMVVVASGPLRRDQLLTAQMLTYAPLPRNSDESQYFTSIEGLVGKQLRKSVSTNQAISEDLLGDPIVIQRNELIEVESVAGSVVVRTSAKSLAAGTIGDLIDIEMPNRKRLMATVVGPAKVRISATSVSSTLR